MARRALASLALILSLLVALAPYPATAQDSPTGGQAVESLAAFDRAMLELMARWQFPGGALAVVRQGRLVFARGYGFADREVGQPVQPDSLFRIASLSKPVTAAAALKLAEEGRFDLEAKAFRMLEDLAPAFTGTAP